MILAGDIGGTKTNIAFFEDGGRPKAVAQQTFPSREHAGLEEIVGQFISHHALRVRHAAFGVAGPVRNGRCEATNLPWVVDAATLAAELGIRDVWVINDLEASAYGIAALAPTDLVTISSGAADAAGNAAIIAAGTGLGEAGLYWDGRMHHPFATEGGHANFGASDAVEAELLHWLSAQFGHVSWERLVSGPGLLNIYRFLRDTGRGEEPAWLAEEMRAEDPAAVISRAAQSGKSPLCLEALDRFMGLYGSEAGNLALKTMATGGVYVGGGIAPKNLDKLKDGTFMKRFVAKGRMQKLLEAMPVNVILNDKTALLGAARCAAVRSGLT
ncbi:MAG TPA: glucokinase [Gemmatimonadales bacterium]|nr:glucokinase [Gemmatimonadales bacterium]